LPVFRVGAVQISANSEILEPIMSQHSGKVLARLHIDFSAAPHNADAVKGAMLSHPFELLDEGGNGRKWKVETSSESYSGDPWSATHRFNVRLVEREELAVTELVIDELVLQPYFYDEKVVSESLEVEARVRLSASDVAALRKLQAGARTLAVIRRGISETPRKMRFGRLMWSLADGEYKYNIVLFDEGKVQVSFLQDPIIGYSTSVALETKAGHAKLVELLRSKGLLTETELEAINSATPPDDEWLELDRVSDLDEHFSR
jgi:hypothetical protein